MPLVISSVGFEVVLVEPEQLNKNLKVLLNEKVYEIDKIDILSKPCSWSREKMVKTFFREFIGESRIAQTCVIENIDDVYLYFNDKTKVLHGISKKPILIRNKALGYNIQFTLDYFQWTKKGTSYKGYSVFEEHTVSRVNELQKIRKKRKFTYLGSPMHFFKSLYYKNIQRYRFQVYLKEDVKIDPPELYSMLEKIDGKTRFLLNEPIYIQYGMESVRSTILPRTKFIEISPAGYSEPTQFEMQGYFAQFRVGDMLPFDYEEY